MDGTYYVIKNVETGQTISPPAVSTAPHLYSTRGKAEARRKAFGFRSDKYVVTPVQLIEIKEI